MAPWTTWNASGDHQWSTDHQLRTEIIVVETFCATTIKLPEVENSRKLIYPCWQSAAARTGPDFVEIGILTDSGRGNESGTKSRIENETRIKIECGISTKTENGTGVENEYGHGIRIKSVTGIGIKSTPELRMTSIDTKEVSMSKKISMLAEL
ncbi:hypothetical protein EVAR_63095_1 [Eumeta japonica]|uniref:Uncharacterized protein n=1 Tax=Eumeta variegata TaxID=151549 RepID=A0A4C1ZVW9_EUMVA|nr:hypothetical protein EVAR_63095_1 [Eumeta japonica]